MLVSYKWLQEYFENPLPEANALADLLSVKAFEIEGVEKKDDDSIIDVDVLPNRAHDCLSHYGIAREIATLTNQKIRDEKLLQNIATVPGQFDSAIKTNVESDLCRRYMTREIRNVKVGPSPEELRTKLESIGQRSINNIVDITNIVMYELGQPMHAFDVDKLSGGQIIVRMAEKGEQIVTLDNKEVELDEKTLVIADAEKPIAIAGVKGGKSPEVNEATKNIILESANFHPGETRKTARRVNIATDSSKRFENEITPELAPRAIEMATALIMKYAATDETQIANVTDHYPRPWRAYTTGVSLAEVSALLGVDFSAAEIEEAFRRLDFSFELVDVREKVVAEAKKLEGKPYKWGASVFFDAPNIFDCSSLTSYVYSLAGLSIPRMAVDQLIFSNRIEKTDLLPGDLIFSNTGDLQKKIDYESVEFAKGTPVESGVDHVGIYLGDDLVLHATQDRDMGTIVEKISDSERFKNIIGYGQMVPPGEKRYAVTPRLERLDIKNGPDLIEEIGRVLGYDLVSAAPIEMNGFEPRVNQSYAISTAIRNAMTELGFSEIITYVFVPEGELSPEKPLAEDRAFLRSSLTYGAQTTLEKNVRNADLLGVDHVKVFEIGKVFDRKGERNMLSIGVMNKNGVKKPVAAELIREAVAKIEESLGANLNVKVSDNENVVEINLDKVIEKMDQPLELPQLVEIPADAKYAPFSQYPFVLRDIAVWVPEDVSEGDVLEVIRAESNEWLVKSKIFDVYTKDGRTSYAYRLVFQSMDQTLTDDAVNEVMNKITDKMNGELKWEVR